MILDNFIIVNVTPRNKSNLKNLGYDIHSEKIKIKPTDLPKGSHVKVTVKCENCGKVTKLRYHKYLENKERQGVYRCKKCSKITRKNTFQNNYDTDNIMKINYYKEKGKNTKLQNYGNKDYNNIEKHQKTCLEKYGTKYVLQNKKIREKGKITKLNKYNNENFVNVEKRKTTIRNKEYNKIIKKYTDLDFKGLEDDLYKIQCNKGHIYKISHKLLYQRKDIYKVEPCTICNPLYNFYSENEKLLKDFIKNNYNGKIECNKKYIIGNEELDIFLPDINIAFEYNGLYWHNELYKNKYYHKNKSNKCKDKGIQLIHIWEDDWIYKNDIIKSMILNKLNKSPHKIYARNCKIKEIKDNSIVKDFLNENHIQGFVGSSIKIGLFYENELVSIMTFGKKRVTMKSKSNVGEYELLRFCNKKYYNVVGSASKLFSFFIKTFFPKNIITYADKSYSNGQLYKKLNFKYEKETQPNYFYVKKDKRLYRFNFRKDILIKEGYNPNESEHQIMLKRKIFRIYNAGHYKFIWKK